MPCGYRVKNPEELGIIPLIMGAAAAAPGIIKGVGGLLKKKKKPAPKPAAATKPTSASSAKAKPKAKASTAKPVSAASLSAVPATVKQDVLASLKQFQTQEKSTKKTHEDLVNKLSQVVVPDLSKVVAQVKDATISRKVTSQHNKLMKEDKRWADSQARQDEIIKRMSMLEAALLQNSSRANRIFQIYGVHPQ